MRNSRYTNIRWIVRRDQLEKWVTLELRQLFSKAVMQLEGYQIKLMWSDRDSVKFTDSGNIIFESGIQIFQPAGLFSVEAFGRIQAELGFEIMLNEKLELETTIKIIHHIWSEPPKVKIGKLLIPIESISNYVISKMEDDISNNVRQKIKESLDIPALIGQWLGKTGNNYPLNKEFGVFLNAQMDALQIQRPRLESEFVILDSQVAMSATLSDRRLSFRSVSRPELLLNRGTNCMGIDLSFRWDNLSTSLKEILKNIDYGGKPVDAENLNITWDEKLFISLDLVSPVRMSAAVTLNPYFDPDTGNIQLNSYTLDITPDNILYKLATPVIRSTISKQLESFFPLNLNELLKTQLVKGIPEKILFGRMAVKHSYETICLEDIVFSKQGLEAKIRVEALQLIVHIDLNP